MIVKTNKFRVKIDVPLYAKDEIVVKCFPPGIQYEDFPDVFEPVYKLEDGSERCIGDHIWRSKNYEVKSTLFSIIHITQDTPIFGSKKACEKWLEKNAKNIKTELLKQNRDSSFQTLKAWANKLDNLEKLSYRDLELIRDGIRTSIKNIERI